MVTPHNHATNFHRTALKTGYSYVDVDDVDRVHTARACHATSS